MANKSVTPDPYEENFYLFDFASVWALLSAS